MAKRKKKPGGSNGMLVMAVSAAGSILAASLARKALQVSWKAVTGEPPPDDPKSRETDWVVAVSWAVASGAAIGVARLLAERQVAGRIAGQPQLEA